MKKIKVPFETKVAIVAFLIMCVICGIAVGVNFFAYGGVAHAEGEEIAEATEPQVVVVEKEVEKDDLATVFKNNILPYVVSGAEAFLALLIVIFPYIKTKGQLKALQGAYTVASKTIEAYKAKEGELTNDTIVEKFNTDVVEGLKDFIVESVKNAVKDNVSDTTGDIVKIQSTVDTLAAQMTNLIKSAMLVWGEADGVKELLSKSPTAAVIDELYMRVRTLEAKLEEKNAEDTAEARALAAELEVYQNEKQ